MKPTKQQLETDVRSLRVKLANAERLAIERLNQLNDMQLLRHDDQRRLNEATDELNASERDREWLVKQRDEASSAADDARNVALDDIAKAWREVEDALARLNRERDEARNAAAQADVDRYAATQERDEARKERDAKTRECIDLVGSVRDLERDIVDERKNLDYWKRQHNDLMCKYMAALSRIDQLTAQRDTAEREREEYAGQLTEAEKRLGEYSEKLVKTCAAVSFLEGQLTTTEKSRDWWKGEHNKEFDKRLEAEAKLKAMTRKITPINSN